MTMALSMTDTSPRPWRPSPLWLAVPGFVLLVVFFAFPVARLLVLSVQDAQTGGFSLASFARITTTDVYIRVLGITFKIAGYTAIFSLLLGYPLAYWLARMPDAVRGRLLLFVMVPFWTSYLVKTFAFMLLLGRTGVINDLLLGTGIVSQPLPLINNEFGVMVGMVHAMVPLAVMTMLPVMTGIDRRLVQAAQTLGASPVHAFWLVYFKLSLPGVAAAGLLVFISAIGYYITPALVGGGQDQLVSYYIATFVNATVNWGMAAALSVVLIAVIVLLLLAFSPVIRKSRHALA